MLQGKVTAPAAWIPVPQEPEQGSVGRSWWTQTQDEDRGVGSGGPPGGGWKFELTVRPRDLTQGSEFPRMLTAEPSLLIRSFFILHSLTYS